MDCVYKDPNAPVEARVKDLLSRMTLLEKIGQMTQIERSVASASAIKHRFIGLHFTISDSVCVCVYLGGINLNILVYNWIWWCLDFIEENSRVLMCRKCAEWRRKQAV